MELSARNQIKGKVTEVRLGAVAAQVKVDIGGNIVNSMITVDSVKELGIEQGSNVTVLIKSTEVMLAV